MFIFTEPCPHSLTGRIHILGGDSSKRPVFLTPHNHSGDCPILSMDFDASGNNNITFMDLAELDEFIATLEKCRKAMKTSPWFRG